MGTASKPEGKNKRLIVVFAVTAAVFSLPTAAGAYWMYAQVHGINQSLGEIISNSYRDVVSPSRQTPFFIRSLAL